LTPDYSDNDGIAMETEETYSTEKSHTVGVQVEPIVRFYNE
jgi:hypothetical protein